MELYGIDLQKCSHCIVGFYFYKLHHVLSTVYAEILYIFDPKCFCATPKMIKAHVFRQNIEKCFDLIVCLTSSSDNKFTKYESLSMANTYKTHVTSILHLINYHAANDFNYWC